MTTQCATAPHLHANPWQRGQDVGEEDHTVGSEGVPRLQGDLNNQLGDLGSLTKAWVLLGQLPVRLLVPLGAWVSSDSLHGHAPMTYRLHVRPS